MAESHGFHGAEIPERSQVKELLFKEAKVQDDAMAGASPERGNCVVTMAQNLKNNNM